jgi:hypothetical protein
MKYGTSVALTITAAILFTIVVNTWHVLGFIEMPRRALSEEVAFERGELIAGVIYVNGCGLVATIGVLVHLRRRERARIAGEVDSVRFRGLLMFFLFCLAAFVIAAVGIEVAEHYRPLSHY